MAYRVRMFVTLRTRSIAAEAVSVTVPFLCCKISGESFVSGESFTTSIVVTMISVIAAGCRGHNYIGSTQVYNITYNSDQRDPL